MSKKLTLSLNASEIKQAIKADTYITGQIDKSADMVKNAALAFNEQAGDEEYHNSKIFRTMKGSLAKFEAQIAEYIETSDINASVSDTLTSQSATTFTITLTVGERTSGAFATTLAYLAQEYIINTSLYYWWQPIKPTLAKDYLAFATDNINDVRRCLAKSAPTAENVSYEDISGKIQAQSSISFPSVEYDITFGETFETPEITTFPSDMTVSYASSNEEVATVDAETGAVSIAGEGDTVITASFAGNDDYMPSSAFYVLHVNPSE